MAGRTQYDVVVVGSGPNGLAAAITLARESLAVLLIEGEETVGGGMRSAELTLPGFVHDVCATVHPLGVASPFFRSLELSRFGLEWIHPPASLAHPLDNGTAVLLQGKSIDLPGQDGYRFDRIVAPLAERFESLVADVLSPLKVPNHPLFLLQFGRNALRSAVGFSEKNFREEPARALFAGMAAHSILPLERTTSASFGLILAAAGWSVGWPVAKGGSQRIAEALAACLTYLGGEIRCGRWIRSMDEIPKARAVFFDVTPRQLAAIAPQLFPNAYLRRLQRHPYGPGIFKMDWALSQPIPWQAPECLRAATVHVGGTLEEIAYSERIVWQGRCPEKPFVLMAQQSLFDPSRAPAGKETAWGYCHVPNSSQIDMTDRIESQIERYAPGFRDCVLERSVWPPARLEQHNPNYVGGDILGGRQDLARLLLRPLGRWRPYRTPAKGVFICSSSMPPGGGVHGMCGYHAARAALRDLF